MWIFRKKSNQPIVTSELPPELRPFYGQQKPKDLPTRQMLAIIPLVLLMAAVILAGIWLYGSTGVNQPNPSAQSSTQASVPPKTQPKTAGSSQSTPSIASVNEMPDTGPGTNIFLLAASVGLLGAFLYHAKQVRDSNKN